MDSPLSTLGFVIFGITFSIYSVIAESQNPSTSVSPPPPPRPPPLPSPSPPRPPPLPYTTSPPPLSSYPSTPPPAHHSHSPPPHHHFSPPHNLAHADPGAKKANRSPANPRLHHRLSPRPPSHQMKRGKKIGLLFAGIAGIMQIGVVCFLVFKRRQLLRTKDAFEAST